MMVVPEQAGEVLRSYRLDTAGGLALLKEVVPMITWTELLTYSLMLISFANLTKSVFYGRMKVPARAGEVLRYTVGGWHFP